MNFNPFEILKNADTIKSQMNKLQEELRSISVTGSSGGGLVKVTMNGQFEISSIILDPIAVDPRDIQMLQDLIVAASRDAYTRAQECLKEKLGPLAAGTNIPGLNFPS